MNETSIVMTENALACRADSGWVLDQSCQTSAKNPGDSVTLDASMKKAYAARPYQTDCLVKLAEMRAQGIDRGIMVMACGLGKTITAVLDVEQFLREHPRSRVLYLCHNGEILAGARQKFEAYFGSRYSYGFFMTYANKIEADDTQKKPTFLFASFQTMNRRRKQFAPDEFDYILIDEAHHVQAKTFAPTVRYFRPKFQLGMTATPFRMDGKKIEELLGDVIYNMDITRGVFEGWLANLHYKLMLDDISLGLKDFLDKNQKYTLSQLNREVFMPVRDKEIIARIKQHAKGKGIVQPKMVIYCKTIKHARRIATVYGRDKAMVVYSGQSAEEVEDILKRLERGEIEAVTSVQKLNEGIDLPSLNMLVFLRNTVSRNVYEQQLGRGTRREEGKDVIEILDFVANAERMKFVFEFWQELQDRARRYYGGEEVDDADEDDVLGDVNIDEGNTKIVGNSKPKNPGKSRGTRTKGGKIPKFDQHFVLDFYDDKFKEQDIDIMDVLERAYQGREWTKEEGLAALAEYAKELGRAPKMREAGANPDLPSVNWYVTHFGSYSNALRMIGHYSTRNFTDEEGLTILAEFMKELGRMPTAVEVDLNPDLPSTTWYKYRYGSYNNALREIGAHPVARKKRARVTDEEGLTILAEFMKELGRVPTQKEIKASPNIPSITWYKRRFGSYYNALKRIGVQLIERKHVKMSEEEGLEALAKYAEELGRSPMIKEVDANPDLPNADWYKRRFGNYGNALRLIGRNGPRVWTAELTLEATRQEFERCGKFLPLSEVTSNPNLPAFNTYKRLFGSYNKAKELIMHTYQSVVLPPKKDIDSDEAENVNLAEVEDSGN